VTQLNINAQNLIVADTETLEATSASNVATTRLSAEVSATEKFYTKKAEGDKAFWDNYKAGLVSLMAALGTNFAATSDTTTRNMMSF